METQFCKCEGYTKVVNGYCRVCLKLVEGAKHTESITPEKLHDVLKRAGFSPIPLEEFEEYTETEGQKQGLTTNNKDHYEKIN